MREVFRVRVIDHDGSWSVGLERAGEAMQVQRFAGPGVQAMLADHHRALEAVRNEPGVLVRGRDARVTAGETTAGRALAPLISGLRLGNTPAVAIEAPSAAQVVWELLAATPDAPSLEAADDAIVVRLLPGRLSEIPRQSERLRVCTVVAQDTSADPVVQRVVAAVTQATADAGFEAPVHTLVPEPEDLVVLHLVAHGEQEGGIFQTVQGGEGADTLVARLPFLARVDLVVASICHGGHAGTADLPGRLLRAGAPACVAPRGPVQAEAAVAFVQGLYRALAQGLDVVGAVAHGRRAVRSLGLPHPDARWHLFSLAVAHLDRVADSPRHVLGWRPEGWPAPASSAARVLREVERAGAPVGYVGVEHLVAVLADAELPAGLKAKIRPRAEELLRFQYLRRQGSAGPLHVSPWLAGLGRDLPAAFSVADLARALTTRGWVHLLVLAGQLDVPLPRATVPDGVTAYGATEAAEDEVTHLEVLFGPEGGRRLPATPGASVGRFHVGKPADQPLYRDTPVTDSELSRAELRWLEGGRLYWEKAGKPLEPKDFLAPRVFGSCTWLLGRGRA